MMRIKSDFVDLLTACAKGELKNKSVEIDSSFVATVVLAAGGYPDQYEKGKIISGLNEALSAQVFHAGTKTKEGTTITDGGRVMAVTGKGKSLNEARENAYKTDSQINWDGKYSRTDIGADLMRFFN
jgi:phosphoribosylamine--glycine ligase